MVGRDCDICLRATDHPEFDAWRWNEYWVPLDAVIEFKRDVYQLALTELSRFLRRPAQRADKPRGPRPLRYPRIVEPQPFQSLTIVDTSVVCSEVEVGASTLDETSPPLLVGK